MDRLSSELQMLIPQDLDIRQIAGLHLILCSSLETVRSRTTEVWLPVRMHLLFSRMVTWASEESRRIPSSKWKVTLQKPRRVAGRPTLTVVLKQIYLTSKTV